MLITDEKELILKLGYVFTDIMKEMQRQYSGEEFVFGLAAISPEGAYERAEMYFETPGEEEVLFVSCVYNVNDTTDGSIDEFYKDKKDKVVSWVQLSAITDI